MGESEMNAPVRPQQRQITVDQYRQEILPPEKASDLWRSLPSHIKPAVFERNLTNALMQNPQLMQFDSRLVFREVSKSAALGLLLDPQLGEAYIVPAWNGRTKRVEPQLRIGYKGMCKLARQGGDVTNIYAHEVCAKDRIECHLGTDKRLVHEPNVFTDRGNVVGYYAVIKYADGSSDFEPMTVQQCRDIRDRSDAWKAFTSEKIKSTPWATDEGEMSKKTVLRRLLKRQPQSPELTEAISIEDTADFPEMRNAPRPTDDESPPPPSTVGAIEHKPAIPMETVEDSYLAMLDAGRIPPGQEIWDDPPPPNKAHDPVKLKNMLLTEIVRAGTADLDRLVNDPAFYDQKQKLSPADQNEIDLAWMKRKNELRNHK
jgi:recombination protein RecT